MKHYCPFVISHISVLLCFWSEKRKVKHSLFSLLFHFPPVPSCTKCKIITADSPLTSYTQRMKSAGLCSSLPSSTHWASSPPDKLVRQVKKPVSFHLGCSFSFQRHHTIYRSVHGGNHSQVTENELIVIAVYCSKISLGQACFSVFHVIGSFGCYYS